MSDKSFRCFMVSCIVSCCASLVSVGAIYEKAGFYAGLSVGAGYNAGSLRGSATEILPDETYNIPNKLSICGFEKNFCGFVGWMTHLPHENWLAGIELGIEKPFYKKHIKAALEEGDPIFYGDPLYPNCQYKIKTMFIAKLHAKIGKILNEKWFVYGLVGVDLKKEEISMREEILGKMKGRKFFLGFAMGLGVEREISENWRLGLECVNSLYPTRTVKSLNEDRDYRYHTRLKTNSTQVSLRLTYNF